MLCPVFGITSQKSICSNTAGTWLSCTGDHLSDASVSNSSSSFLGAFAYLPVTSVTIFRLYVCPHVSVRLQVEGFLRNLIFGLSRISVKKPQLRVKIGYSTWRPTYGLLLPQIKCSLRVKWYQAIKRAKEVQTSSERATYIAHLVSSGEQCVVICANTL